MYNYFQISPYSNFQCVFYNDRHEYSCNKTSRRCDTLILSVFLEQPERYPTTRSRYVGQTAEPAAYRVVF